MTPSICSINIDIGKASQWAQGCKRQQVGALNNICCSHFLTAMDSVVKPRQVSMASAHVLEMEIMCPSQSQNQN